MANSTKQNQRKLALMQKIWLQQVLAKQGLTGMLYACPNKDSLHPFTQAIMLYADEQGMTVERIAQDCQVPVKLVNSWKTGDALANMLQLSTLIKHLSPRAPGEHFWSLTVIKGTPCFHFPPHWEEQMLANVQELSLDDFRQALKFAIDTKIDNKINSIEQDVQGELEKVNQDIVKIEQLYASYQQEIAQNNQERKRYQLATDTLIQSDPNYAKLNSDDMLAILERKLAPAKVSHQAKDAYMALLQHFQFDEENHHAYLADLRNIAEKLSSDCREIQSQRSQLAKEYNPLNNYSRQNTPLIAHADLNGHIKASEIERLSKALYPRGAYYDFRFHQHTSSLSSVGFFSRQKINAVEALKSYLTAQTSCYEGEERIQLCGRYLISFPKSNDMPYCCQKIEENNDYRYHASFSRRSSNEECLDLFQLQSHRLALICSVANPNKNGRLCQLHEFTNIDSLLGFLSHYLSQSKLNEWKKMLIELGYVSASARVVC